MFRFIDSSICKLLGSSVIRLKLQSNVHNLTHSQPPQLNWSLLYSDKKYTQHVKYNKSSHEQLENDLRNQKDLSHQKSSSDENSKKTNNDPLYENHIPTNAMQKAFLSVGAAAAALLDPKRHDMVAVLGETTGFSSLSLIHSEMSQDKEGQLVLRDKPRINSTTIDLENLSKLPIDTLGYAYIKFLKDNNVTPDSRLPVQFVDDPELAYVMQRYRESHDLFHTVLGMPTNMVGEVAVKWVEGLQLGLPMCIGGAIFGPLRFKTKQRQKYLSTYLPWAVRVGRNSKFLMNMYFENRWEQSLDNIRTEFKIEAPPIL